MSSWWLVFAVFLFFVSAALIIAEVFVPSGGVISVFALACLIGGVAIFFEHSRTAGWLGIIIAAVMVPFVVVAAYRIFPRTKFGRSVTLEPPKRKVGDAIPDSDQLRQMLGKEGVVLTPLRPVGTCDFDGRRLECVAESGFVEKDKRIRVIDVEGTQLTVRVVEEA